MLCFVWVILNYVYHTNPKAVILGLRWDLTHNNLHSRQVINAVYTCMFIYMYMHYFTVCVMGVHVYTGGELHYSCQLLPCSEKTSQETVQKASQLP